MALLLGLIVFLIPMCVCSKYKSTVYTTTNKGSKTIVHGIARIQGKIAIY
ncbi:hypothetical protein Fmac_017019 [Flemingia macrophylla]|uniref:Uncharacterized protein n=1 Tax=Flemingia macrophylla TaxID=520843 RepID=A0ABD1M0Z0_9FABA